MLGHYRTVFIVGMMVFSCFLVSPVSASYAYYEWIGTYGQWTGSSNWTVTEAYDMVPNPYPQTTSDSAFIRNGGTVVVSSDVGPVEFVHLNGHSTLIQTGGNFSVHYSMSLGYDYYGGPGTVILAGGSFYVPEVTKTGTTTDPFSFIIKGTGPTSIQCPIYFAIGSVTENPNDTVYFQLDSDGVTPLYTGYFNCPKVNVSLLPGEALTPGQKIDLIRVSGDPYIVIGGVRLLRNTPFTLDYDLPVGYEVTNEIVYEGNWTYLRMTVVSIPEPATIALLAIGALSLVNRKR